MTGWLTFEAVIEPMEWGRATYTILRLPPHIADELATLGARRVEGEFAEHPVNLALTRAPVVDGVFLWAGKSMLDQAGLEPGAPFEARLRPAPDDLVDLPADVEAALLVQGVLSDWAALTAGKRRGLLYQVQLAKAPATRARRIAVLVAGLTQ